MPSVGVAAFIFRICVGMFSAFVLSAVSWVMVRFIMLSFFLMTPLFDQVMSAITIGIAAGLGASVGSWMLEISKRQLSARILVGMLAGLCGAGVGLQYGKDVYIMAGMPGIAELSNIVWGAMIAGNAVPIIFDLVTAFRRRRF